MSKSTEPSSLETEEGEAVRAREVRELDSDTFPTKVGLDMSVPLNLVAKEVLTDLKE